MIRAVLFDLDGTLLHYDFDAFVREYLSALGARLAHLIEPDKLARQVMASTDAMIRDRDPARTNSEVFAADFFPAVGFPREQLMPEFDEFYRLDFPHLRERVPMRPAPGARAVVEHLMASGLDVVIATNPVFPLVAIEERLRWADLDGLPFRLVTSYEIMHFCKPHPEYFREVADLIGRPPGECLMAGNDVEEDMAAAAVGMRTYLVLDLARARGRGRSAYRPDFEGTFADLALFIRSGAVMGV